MIEEDYVSFETAKLLKEKGFNEGCRLHYHYVEAFNEYFSTDESISGFEQYYYPCPTLQMAMKWLREVHRIVIMLYYANVCGLGFTYVASVIKINDNHEIEEGPGLDVCVYGDSYEEACETAIKYCLENLI